VAAIGGIINGVAQERIHELEDEVEPQGLEHFHKMIKDMVILLEKSITFVKQKDSSDFQDYHARRLVEMTSNVMIAYLMMRDAAHSERKKIVLEQYIDFAYAEVKMKSEIITNDVCCLIKNQDVILQGKN
ncbi:MAG: hypothetical protein MJB14_22900, partial [Spirochaetes bacterium]|nr:hypothetical protein [Spirochaetota bacterium]